VNDYNSWTRPASEIQLTAKKNSKKRKEKEWFETLNKNLVISRLNGGQAQLQANYNMLPIAIGSIFAGSP
jgi:hypothetical protein